VITPRRLRRNRAAWSPMPGRRALRAIRYHQGGIAAFEGRCWRTTEKGRAAQAALAIVVYATREGKP
jgi:hypothetical protein